MKLPQLNTHFATSFSSNQSNHNPFVQTLKLFSFVVFTQNTRYVRFICHPFSTWFQWAQRFYKTYQLNLCVNHCSKCLVLMGHRIINTSQNEQQIQTTTTTTTSVRKQNIFRIHTHTYITETCSCISHSKRIADVRNEFKSVFQFDVNVLIGVVCFVYIDNFITSSIIVLIQANENISIWINHQVTINEASA